MAKTKSASATLYPIKNRWVHDAPYGVHVPGRGVDTDALIESGAFTDDPSNPDVDADAPDLTVPPVEPEQIPGIPGGEPVPTPELVSEPEPEPSPADGLPG